MMIERNNNLTGRNNMNAKLILTIAIAAIGIIGIATMANLLVAMNTLVS